MPSMGGFPEHSDRALRGNHSSTSAPRANADRSQGLENHFGEERQQRDGKRNPGPKAHGSMAPIRNQRIATDTLSPEANPPSRHQETTNKTSAFAGANPIEARRFGSGFAKPWRARGWAQPHVLEPALSLFPPKARWHSAIDRLPDWQLPEVKEEPVLPELSMLRIELRWNRPSQLPEDVNLQVKAPALLVGVRYPNHRNARSALPERSLILRYR
jgi:hypothetical protein